MSSMQQTSTLSNVLCILYWNTFVAILVYPRLLLMISNIHSMPVSCRLNNTMFSPPAHRPPPPHPLCPQHNIAFSILNYGFCVFELFIKNCIVLFHIGIAVRLFLITFYFKCFLIYHIKLYNRLLGFFFSRLFVFYHAKLKNHLIDYVEILRCRFVEKPIVVHQKLSVLLRRSWKLCIYNIFIWASRVAFRNVEMKLTNICRQNLLVKTKKKRIKYFSHVIFGSYIDFWLLLLQL